MSDWKETEFGKIPIEWDLKKIIDLKSSDKNAIAMGPFGSNIKAENFILEGVPVIRGTNLNFYKYVGGEFVFLNNEKADQLKGSNCRAGDLVFTHRGTIGQVGIIPKGKYSRYVISQSGMKLTVDETKINNEFLFYFFKSKGGQYQLLKNEGQVGVPSISNPLTTLKELEVPLPELSEQTAITCILSSLDDKIALLYRQNKTLEQLAETIFRQWFVEGAGSKTKFELGKVAEVGTGKGLKREEFIENGLYPVLGANGEIGRTNNFLTDERMILTGRVGTLGKIYINDNKVWISDNVLMIMPNEERLFYSIYFALKQINFENLNVGSTQPLITQTDLKKIQITIPKDELLNEFSSQSSIYFKKINKNKYQIHTLTQLRDTLLPKLMSGEVRVKM